MASIGQLAAGVAHEINNPIAYVNSNLASLKTYLNDLFRLIYWFETQQTQLPPQSLQAFKQLQQEIDYDYLVSDIPLLLTQSHDGIERVRKIVKDLREFSHADSGEMALCDVNDGIRSTLNIVQNEFKDKAEMVLNLGVLPLIECNLSQLNQVFLNVVINACHAIKTQGHIHISTGEEEQGVWVKIADDGEGIAPENLKRIFDAFFTTKPVGKGTGLGLSLSYSIIKSHHGIFEVSSVLGEGTEFLIHLPFRQP